MEQVLLSEATSVNPIMAKSKLTLNELQALLDYDPRSGLFMWKVSPNNNSLPAGSIAGRMNAKNGYVHISIKNTSHAAHRLAWFYMTGKWPECQIDHINRIRNDNRIVNLRESNQSENMANCDVRVNNISGVTGVHWDQQRKKWMAYIKKDYKRIHIGRFDNKQDAIDARAAKELELFGQFSPLSEGLH